MTILRGLLERRNAVPVMTHEQIAGESYVWGRLTAELQKNSALAAIVRILNTVEQQQNDQRHIRDFFERDLKDAKRLYGLAKSTIRSLDPQIVENAIEDVAHLLVEGLNGEYGTFEDQHPHIQSYHRRLAQSAVNRYMAELEGDRG